MIGVEPGIVTGGNDHAPPTDRFQLAQTAFLRAQQIEPRAKAVSIQVPIPSSNTASTLPSSIALRRDFSPGRETHCKPPPQDSISRE